jgi:acyl-[acyl carrier protein]--UDP-N-acetylglucosamine O-acyltransferase
VYKFTTLNAALSKTLTLNGTSNADGQFIFQISTTFATTASTSKIVLIGGAQACNVYFIVGSSATIGAGSQLQGNILAYTSIAVLSGASNKGTFCALHGAVTLIDDALTAQTTCTT